MSEVEAHQGKLIPIDREGKTLDEWIQSVLQVDEKPDYETWFSYYDEQSYEHPEKYKDIYYNMDTDTLYEVRSTQFNPEEIRFSQKNDDGSYDFTVSFYNGGASLSEILDDIID